MDTPPSDSNAPAPDSTPPPPASLSGWYRFALMLTGRPDTAAAALKKAFTELEERLSRLPTPSARRAWMVSRLKKDAAKKPEGETPWAAFAALPEPERTAYGLFQSLSGDLLDQEELTELAGCRNPAALASALSSARRGLLPEAALPEDSLLPLHCPWRDDSPAVATAVRSAQEQNSPTLAAQITLDHEWQQRTLAVEPPDGLALPTLTGTAPEHHQFLRHPAALAMIGALIVMLGAIGFLAKERMDEFPGREMVETLVEEQTEGERQLLEAIEPTELSRMGDWFLLKGFDDFHPPAELNSVKAEACRVFRHEGVPVAHLALEPRRAELFVYRSEQLPSRVESQEWIFFRHDDWAVATRSEGGSTYVVVIPGDPEDLPGFLKNGK